MGVAQLGGTSIFLSPNDTQISRGETIADTARVLSEYLDGLIVRTFGHDRVAGLAENASIPVINGLTDLHHPCQALADLLTIYEAAGTLSGQTLTYVGIHNNVANSLALGCARTGTRLILVTPEVNPPAHDPIMLDELERAGVIERTLDLRGAVQRSQFVYTDTWVDMEFFNDPAFEAQKNKRIETMRPYQLNREILDGSSAQILHDMPIHPGFEIAEELIDDPRSLIYRQAENRLYAQQALMIHLLDGGA
ncbi:MAG: ornithine carbamoyltransferase [SAR324 cluster bacterium]|nr:ornithine carbamoyltransferase [SAR324 cluster bacterium]